MTFSLFIELAKDVIQILILAWVIYKLYLAV